MSSKKSQVFNNAYIDLYRPAGAPLIKKSRKRANPRPFVPKVCPPGKIYNPETRRCKNIPKGVTPKVCPPGKIYNPETRRCKTITKPPIITNYYTEFKPRGVPNRKPIRPETANYMNAVNWSKNGTPQSFESLNKYLLKYKPGGVPNRKPIRPETANYMNAVNWSKNGTPQSFESLNKYLLKHKPGGVPNRKPIRPETANYMNAVNWSKNGTPQSFESLNNYLLKHKPGGVPNRKPIRPETANYMNAINWSKNGTPVGIQRIVQANRLRKSILVKRAARLWKQKSNQTRESKQKANLFRSEKLASKYGKLWKTKLERKALPTDWPGDLQATNVQDYLNDYMKRNKKGQPIEFSKLMGVAGENRCVSQEFKPSKAQALVHAVARGMIQTRSPNRGILTWHSTGSGKTCTLACVMHAYWYTTKRIVFCSSKEGIKANGPKEFVHCLNKFFNMNIDEKKFRKRISMPSAGANGFTFATLANKIGADKQYALTDKKYLDNTVLLIDEVQNLFKPAPAQEKEHKALERFLLTDRDNSRYLKVFIATATPGDTPEEIVKLLNLVRDPTKPPITTDTKTFEIATRGLVSYVNNDNDTTKFPTVKSVIHETVMSDKHYEEYIKKYTDDLKKKSAKVKFSLSRKYSSMAGGDPSKFPDLASFSSKLERMMKNINEFNTHKHYIYSSFYTRRQPGIRVVEMILEKLGYTKLTTALAKTNPGPAKRYCMMTTTDLQGVGAEKPILDVYNKENNRDGKICQLMLASQKFNEGLDLKAVRHIHLLEPLLSQAAVTQTIGRGRRNCSHRQYEDMKQWNVTVHEYFSKLPQDSKVPNVDRLVKEEQGQMKDSPVESMRQILRNNAFDCKTMRAFHNVQDSHTKCTYASESPKSPPRVEKKKKQTPIKPTQRLTNLNRLKRNIFGGQGRF
jgi:hypothetical protein